MNKLGCKMLIVILSVHLLAACRTAPVSPETQIQPTLRASQTPQPTEIDIVHTTPSPAFGNCNDSFAGQSSPKEIWYLCQARNQFTIINHNGILWKFSPESQFGVDYAGGITFMQWTTDEKFIYFAMMRTITASGPVTTNAEALFKMDLSNGKVATVLGSLNASPQIQYVVSISSTDHIAYFINGGPDDITPKKLHLLDAQNSEDKLIPIEAEYNLIGNLVWSNDGKQLAYKLYSVGYGCEYTYSIRLLNLVNDNWITFIKNESIDQCADSLANEFRVITIVADQITLKKGQESWTYNLQSKKLESQWMVTPTP